MNKKLLTSVIGITIGLTGCMSTKVEMNEYASVSLQKADILPSTESLSGQKQKIVVFALDDSNIPLAKKSKSGFTMATSLEGYLSEVGVEIVDRSIADKLSSELLLAETKGKAEYNGPDIADYAITGAISNASFGSIFKKRRVWQDKKGKWHESPAYCRFSAKVTANVKLYKLPNLTFSKAISVDDKVSFTSETSNRNCPINQESIDSLVRQAAHGAVKDSRIKFQNYFSPKAYVLERKISGSKSLIKISAGKNFGFVPESTVTIYNLSVSKNALSGEVTTEEYAVTQGTVTANLIGDDFAWVLIDDEKAKNIKLGDYVKVIYEVGFLEGSMNSLNSVLSF